MRMRVCVRACVCVCACACAAALYAAAVKGHLSTVSRLVEAKANVNTPNSKRVTPLMTTKVLGHDGLQRVLEQAGAKAWVGYDDR